MRPVAAEVQSDVARAARRIDDAMRVLAAAEANVRERRLDLGRALIEARRLFPATGRNAGGWSRFVAERKLNMDVALDAMKYAGYVEEHMPDRQPGDILPSRAEAGLDKGSAAAGALRLVPDADSDDEVDIDRDTWCTPPWITEAIGQFDFDPCSNGRSTVQATRAFSIEANPREDGLGKQFEARAELRVFINPPYSDVPPWVAAYKHTRFCFLLKLDTSTRWFAELHAATQLILIPRRRVNFIPPPGVPPEKAQAQQFPHALFYAHAEDATDAIRAMSWEWRIR